MQKVSERQIIEAFENNEDMKPKSQIARELGITHQALNRRLKKIGLKARDYAAEFAKKRVMITLNELAEQSKSGKTEATKELLKYADLRDGSLLSIGDGSWRISIEKIEKEPEKAE